MKIKKLNQKEWKKYRINLDEILKIIINMLKQQENQIKNDIIVILVYHSINFIYKKSKFFGI